MFVDDQHSATVTLYCDKVACCHERSYPEFKFVTFGLIANFNLFVNAKTLTDLSTYFKDVIQYYYCQFSPMPERFLTIEISQMQPILVSASA